MNELFPFYNLMLVLKEERRWCICIISIHSSNCSTCFSHFVDTLEKKRATTSKNMKVNILSDYLYSLNDDEDGSFFIATDYNTRKYKNLKVNETSQ